MDGQVPVDVFVARRIRFFRQREGLTLNQLSTLMEDISFQQLQKYERGANRVSSSRLYQIANILSVPISSFFPRTSLRNENRLSLSEEKELQNVVFEGLDTKEVFNLLMTCSQIENPEKRRKILLMCQDIVEKVIALDDDE